MGQTSHSSCRQRTRLVLLSYRLFDSISLGFDTLCLADTSSAVSTLIFRFLISLIVLMIDLLAELRVALESSDQCCEMPLGTPAYPDPEAQLDMGMAPG